MRKIAFVLSVFSCLFLTGCTLTSGIDVQSLMEPPKSNVDQEEIHALIETSDGELDLIYPKRGDYRSAIIMDDFNGDGNQDAIGFYSNPDGGIYLKFMTEKNNNWSTVSVFENSGAQVDKVMIGDLDGDGSLEVIVGWGSATSLSATISVYSFEEYKYVENILEYNYNEFLLVDFNGDGVMELFTTSVFTTSEIEESLDTQAMARLYRFEEKPILYLSCELSSLVVKYGTCSFASISEDKNAVIIEGTTAEGGMVTQVVYNENNILIAPFSNDELYSMYNFFQRPSCVSVECLDIDEDGIFEFPYVTVQSGFENTIAYNSYNYNIDWLNYDSDTKTFTAEKRTIVNLEAEFLMTVDPERYITCQLSEANTYVVKERMFNNDGEFIYEKELLTIKVLTQSQWNLLDYQSNYQMLFTSDDNMIYAVENSSYIDEEIKDSIKLLE